jgi:hypothetical protein
MGLLAFCVKADPERGVFSGEAVDAFRELIRVILIHRKREDEVIQAHILY